LVDVMRHRVADAANIVEGEIVGNNATPSVGAEFDCSGQESPPSRYWYISRRCPILITRTTRRSSSIEVMSR